MLRNAFVIDGSGAPGAVIDVIVRGTRIEALGPDLVNPGDLEEIDLTGLTLAPGFIDLHTHLDAQILWDRDVTPSCWHGVTTTILGNCGFGIAPTRPEHRSLILRTFENAEAIPHDALAAGVAWSFETFPEYLRTLDDQDKRLNIGVLLGHTPLRFYVMGAEASSRAASEAEIKEMCSVVRDAMRAGALGFATSKNDAHYGGDGNPVPSRSATADEIAQLVAVLDEVGRGTVTVASGTTFPLSAIGALARGTDRSVTWESLLTGFDSEAGYGSAPPGAALALLEESAGLSDNLWPQVSCRPVVLQVKLDNPYPLITYCWSFKDIAPLTEEAKRATYRDPAWRATARAELGERSVAMWRRVSVQETQVHHDLVGISIGELAASRNVDPLDLLLDLALAEDLGTRFRLVLMNDDEDELEHILRHDRVVLALSDAGAHVSQLCDAVFPTYLLAHWVREKEVLSLERAVWLLTGQAAEVYGLRHRGLVREGYVADLVAFDAATVGPEPAVRVYDFPAGADRLIAGSRGIEHVWVNGTAIRRDGLDVEGAYPGEVVRR